MLYNPSTVLVLANRVARAEGDERVAAVAALNAQIDAQIIDLDERASASAARFAAAKAELQAAKVND